MDGVTQSDPINPPSSLPQSNDQTILYSSISTYPFSSDADFQTGLSSILGHPETPPTTEEISSNQDLVLQAQCFYFARKFGTPPIDPAAYKAFLTSSSSTDVTPAPAQSQTQPEPQSNGTSQADTSNPNAHSTSPTEPQQPPYPPTFAEIVDLITANKPIPGIETIPETVLEPGSSKTDHTSRRRKPWETNTSNPVDDDIFGNGGTVRNIGADETSGSQSAGVDNARADGKPPKSEGVMRILQPDAIPDSGLIAKD